MDKTKKYRQKIVNFIKSRSTGILGEYSMCEGGQVTLYSSCFAVMTLYYMNALEEQSEEARSRWISYINQWQDPETGYYFGPEIKGENITSTIHDLEHVSMHLTAHVLPALLILGGSPVYSLKFAYRFMDLGYLQDWLDARDWKQAWNEGNNLLFIGQFLFFLLEYENKAEAKPALDLYFNWLDSQQDSNTGFWGTNGYCDNHTAMCGGYHQLITYYYYNHEVHYKQQIIDTTLNLQHVDGGFASNGNSGACEDIDAVDILVNMYKLTNGNYRGKEIRRALRKALRNIKRKQDSNGGFVYRRNTPFIHNDLPRTVCPANVPNLFATWFRVHSIAIICEVLTNDPLTNINWQFNPCCSMGWHRKWEKRKHQISKGERASELIDDLTDQANYYWYKSKRRVNKTIVILKDVISRRIHRYIG